MMKLHGLRVSNYYNIAKMGLVEKGIAFEEVKVMPSQDEAFLKMSPIGKIPVLEVDGRFVAESVAILRYLECHQPEPAFYPKDPMAAGLAQQIHDYLDHYIDPPARTLLGAAFFGRETTPEAIAKVGEKLTNNAKALNRITVFGPFIAGDQLTHADIAAVHTLPLAHQIMLHLDGPDFTVHLDGYVDYMGMMKQRPSVQRIYAEREEALAQLGR